MEYGRALFCGVFRIKIELLLVKRRKKYSLKIFDFLQFCSVAIFAFRLFGFQFEKNDLYLLLKFCLKKRFVIVIFVSKLIVLLVC